MAAKKKVKKTRASATSSENSRRLLLAGGGVLGALAIVVAGVWAFRAVDRAVEHALADEPDVVIEWPTALGPDGQPVQLIDPYYQERLVREARSILGPTPDPLSPVPLAALGEHLEQSGWFDGPPRVERTGRGSIVVSGQWRRAAAVVRQMGRDYLVDWQGRPMPAVFDAGTTEYRFVRGTTKEPIRKSDGSIDRTQTWPDTGVIEGLKLIGVLATEPYFDQVAGVDASDFFFDAKLTIVTTRGTEVVWGGPVGEFVPGEASVDDKLARLREIASIRDWSGRLDAGQNRLEIFDERMVYIDHSSPR